MNELAVAGARPDPGLLEPLLTLEPFPVPVRAGSLLLRAEYLLSRAGRVAEAGDMPLPVRGDRTRGEATPAAVRRTICQPSTSTQSGIKSSLICTGTRRNPATAGTDQGD